MLRTEEWDVSSISSHGIYHRLVFFLSSLKTQEDKGLWFRSSWCLMQQVYKGIFKNLQETTLYRRARYSSLPLAITSKTGLYLYLISSTCTHWAPSLRASYALLGTWDPVFYVGRSFLPWLAASAGRVTKHTREEMNLECKTAKREAFTCIHRFQNIMNLNYNQNVLPPMGRAPTPDSTHDFFAFASLNFWCEWISWSLYMLAETILLTK